MDNVMKISVFFYDFPKPVFYGKVTDPFANCMIYMFPPSCPLLQALMLWLFYQMKCGIVKQRNVGWKVNFYLLHCISGKDSV